MSRDSTHPIRVAILVGDEYVERWRWNALASLAAEPDVQITHVVVNDGSEQSSTAKRPLGFVRDAFRRLREYPLWSLVGIGRLLTPDPAYVRPVHIDSIAAISNAEKLSCAPISVGSFWNELPDETVDRLEDVDVIVRFGFGMLKGRILDVSTYGVLSYHPGDIRAYRGQPGGFWEFLAGDSRMGVTVQRLNDTLDGGEIAALEHIDIGDANTWQEVQARAYATAEGMLVPAVRTLTDEDRGVAHPDRLGDLYTIPNGWPVVRYVWKNTRGRVRNALPETVPSPTDVWSKPGVVALLLLLVGLLNTGFHPLFTHHYVVPIHVEQLLGIVLLVYGSVSLLAPDDRQPV